MSVIEPPPATSSMLPLDSTGVELVLPEATISDAASTEDSEAVLAAAMGFKYLNTLAGCQPSAEFLEKVPIGFARKFGILGLAGADGSCVQDRIPLAIRSPRDLPQVEVVARFLGRDVMPLIAPADQIIQAINDAYQQRTGQAQMLIETLDRRDVLQEVEQLHGREDLLDIASRAPVIKLVNLILFEAVQARASDVHIQPCEEMLAVRLRIDGVLYDSFELNKALQEEIVSRVKVMGRMNIAEKLIAQDGRATVQVGDRVIDLRISSVPTSYGERIVIRLLDKSIRLYSLGELGMDLQSLTLFKELITCEHGIILVTGPTGSGKTTTLYAALQELNGKEKNILTLEDPIEYGLQGISQMQVSDKKGMSFASGLRHVLRQDPDILMVGEIRDRETAVMAIQSALTGHLVFSTLHTNDAASAITRLLDLGIEPYLLASSVIGVLAQRLVRRVCGQCAGPETLRAEEFQGLGLSPLAVQGARRGVGCPACRKTGYSGRVGLFELLQVNDMVRQQVQMRAAASEIKAVAEKQGMRSLRQDGLEKVVRGLTTVEEVARVTIRATA